MAIVGTRREEDVDALLPDQRPDQDLKFGLRRREVVSLAELPRVLRDDQLEPAASAGLPDLRLAALAIVGTPKTAGQVDDPMTAGPELEHDPGGCRRLVVRMRRQVQERQAVRRILRGAARLAGDHWLARSLLLAGGPRRPPAGRGILVTGATGGLGRAVACPRAGRGATLLLHGRGGGRLAETMQRIGGRRGGERLRA